MATAPLVTAPRVHADIADLIIEPVVDAIGQATSLVDSGLMGAFGPYFDVDSLPTPALAVDPADITGFGDPLAPLGALSADLFPAVGDNPIHGIVQWWITSPLGQTVDPIINSPFVALTGRGLIDSGIAGTLDNPGGSAGGWLLGDGGPGFDGTPASMASVAGGSAGLVGNGGDSGAAGVGSPVSASALPMETGTSSATVPLRLEAGTEPVVDISVGGGPNIPVLVDTGSTGLVVPIWDVGLQDIGFPTGWGVGSYSGGLDYLYVTLPTTVDFGNGIVTGPTSVDAVVFSFPTSINSALAGAADGILGIGPNATGPGPSMVTAALPGDLSQGVLINEPAGVLQFGPNPLTGGIPVEGAPTTTVPLQVQIGDGPLNPVTGVIDSGGVYGTIPSSVLGFDPTSGVVPAGTEISVYTNDGQTLLYSYVTNAVDGPTVTSGDTMNTGYIPFTQQPVYIDNSPSGVGTTVFGGHA